MRFAWPTLGLFAALLLLFAGAVSDLPSWWHTWPAMRTEPVAASIPVIQPPARVQSAVASDPKRDEQQARLADETNQLAALRTSVDQARQELAALNEQRQRQQAEQARLASQAVPPAAASEPVSAPVAQPVPAEAVTGAAQEEPGARLLATRRLQAAKVAITAGRRVRARWFLRVARPQIEHWTVAAGQSSPVTDVDNAIDLLNKGDRDGAFRAIDHVLAVAGADTPKPQARAD